MKRYGEAERKIMLVTSHRDDTQQTNLNSAEYRAEYRGTDHLRMLKDFGGSRVMDARQAVDNETDHAEHVSQPESNAQHPYRTAAGSNGTEGGIQGHGP